MVCKSAEIGGPCRGRTYGPLIKSPGEILPENSQHDKSLANSEDEESKSLILSRYVQYVWHQVGTNEALGQMCVSAFV